MSTERRGSVLTDQRFTPEAVLQPRPAANPVNATEGGATFDMARWPHGEIQRLREENEILRRSAQSFGALAERLNQALQRERDARMRAGDGSQDTPP